MFPADQNQNPQKITAIIFDVGGVLNEGRPDFVGAFAEHGITLQEDLWANAQYKKLIVKFCTGGYGSDKDEVAARTFAEEICQGIDQKINYEQFKQAWNAVITRLHCELIDEIHTLRLQGYKLFVLSDTNVLHRKHLEELYRIQYPNNKGFCELFDYCYFSYETGNYKGFPDARADQAWRQILEDNKLEADQCLFIDDREEHVERARGLGFYGLHYPAGSTFRIIFEALDFLNVCERVMIKPALFRAYGGETDLAKLQIMLDRCRVPYEIDKSNKPFMFPKCSTDKSVARQNNTKVQKIFENNSIEINFVSGFEVPSYFLIMPKNQAKIDNNFFWLHVESFIRNLRARGYAQYVAYQNFGDQAMKIIPVLSAGDRVDINQKIINAILCYFGEDALSAFDVFPTCNSEKRSLTDQRFQSLRFSRQTVWTHVKTLAGNAYAKLFSDLQRKGVLFAPKDILKSLLDTVMKVVPDELPIGLNIRLMLNEPKSFDNVKEGKEIIIAKINDEFTVFYKKTIKGGDDEIRKFNCDEELKALLLALNFNEALSDENDRVLYKRVYKAVKSDKGYMPSPCAFCDENTIHNQLVLDFGKLLLMFNFRPFAGTKAHFLILTTRHIEDWSDLREDERIILKLIVQSLLQAIQANCGVKKTGIISHVQNGGQAGQTMPHSHLHIMTTPAGEGVTYVLDVASQMVGMQTPPLTPQEMAQMSELFKPALILACLLNAPPPKLLTMDTKQEAEEEEVVALVMFNRDKAQKKQAAAVGSHETKVAYQGSRYTQQRVYPISRFRTP